MPFKIRIDRDPGFSVGYSIFSKTYIRGHQNQGQNLNLQATGKPGNLKKWLHINVLNGFRW